MLEKIDLSKEVDKETYKKVVEEEEPGWGFCRGNARQQESR